jgi:hypothetical protein
MLYNPTNHPLKRRIELPLYYTGLEHTAKVRVEDGPVKEFALDRSWKITVTVDIPAEGYTWLVIEP